MSGNFRAMSGKISILPDILLGIVPKIISNTGWGCQIVPKSWGIPPPPIFSYGRTWSASYPSDVRPGPTLGILAFFRPFSAKYLGIFRPPVCFMWGV